MTASECSRGVQLTSSRLTNDVTDAFRETSHESEWGLLLLHAFYGLCDEIQETITEAIGEALFITQSVP